MTGFKQALLQNRWLGNDVFLTSQPTVTHACEALANGLWFLPVWQPPDEQLGLLSDIITVWELHDQYNSSCYVPLLAGWIAARTVADEEKTSNDACELRKEFRLPVSTLAKLVGVTRQAYYGWIDGSPISAENQQRLRSVQKLLRTVARLRDDVGGFIEEESAAGKISDLIQRGADGVVVGLATSRPHSYRFGSRGRVRNLGLQLDPDRAQDVRSMTSFAPEPYEPLGMPAEDHFVPIGSVRFR